MLPRFLCIRTQDLHHQRETLTTQETTQRQYYRNSTRHAKKSGRGLLSSTTKTATAAAAVVAPSFLLRVLVDTEKQKRDVSRLDHIHMSSESPKSRSFPFSYLHFRHGIKARGNRRLPRGSTAWLPCTAGSPALLAHPPCCSSCRSTCGNGRSTVEGEGDRTSQSELRPVGSFRCSGVPTQKNSLTRCSSLRMMP